MTAPDDQVTAFSNAMSAADAQWRNQHGAAQISPTRIKNLATAVAAQLAAPDPDSPLTTHDLPDGQIRVWAQGHAGNDFGRMYVLDVHGVVITIKERQDGTVVDIDRDADSTPTDHPNLLIEATYSIE